MIFTAKLHKVKVSRHSWHDFHSPPFIVFQLNPELLLVREQFGIKNFVMFSIAL